MSKLILFVLVAVSCGSSGAVMDRARLDQAVADNARQARRRACLVAIYDETADPRVRADCHMRLEEEQRAEAREHEALQDLARSQEAEEARRIYLLQSVGETGRRMATPQPATTTRCRRLLGELVCETQ